MLTILNIPLYVRTCTAHTTCLSIPLSLNLTLIRVNKRTQTPVNAVWFNTLIGALLLLLMFVNEIAIGAIFSVSAIAQYFAWTVPIFIRVFVVSDRFRPGPWNLGRFSRPIGAVAVRPVPWRLCSSSSPDSDGVGLICQVGFVALMIPILCLPTVRGKDLNPSTMNWTIVVWGGPLLAAFIWFQVSAHKWFKGPVVSRDVPLSPGHRGRVADGIAGDF